MSDATEDRSAPSLLAVHGGLVAVQLAFASHHVVSKVIVEHLPPAALALTRALTAAAILLVLHLWRRGLPRVPLADLAKLAGCALLGIAANQVLFFEGLKRTAATNASVLVTTIPVFALLLSLALRREPPTRRGIGGIALALGGVLYLVGAEAMVVGFDTIVGDLLIVANSACYGSYLVLVASLVKKHGSMTAVVWLFFFGSLWVAPFGASSLWTHAPTVSPIVWLAVLHVIVVATVFAYVVNAWALKHAPTSTVAIYIYLQPVAATGLAVAFLGEQVTPRLVVAGLLVFAGIFLVTRRPPAPIGGSGGSATDPREGRPPD